ncbi:MAG: autotransporter-associated beta strand repeat-containing protein [Deltaproteobacteria bacterium]|jgi:autotransporter-associated beta strand protein|nr:autotransporter-associated beta strand repeat-containing protein [Deltaproteobacteria bacterium]
MPVVAPSTHSSKRICRRIFTILFTLVLLLGAPAPATALESGFYLDQTVGSLGTDSYYWVNGLHGKGLWQDIPDDIDAYYGWYRGSDYKRSHPWLNGSNAYFAKLSSYLYPKKFTVYPNGSPTVYYFGINNSSRGGNYLFTPAPGDAHAAIIGGERGGLKFYDAWINIGGSNEHNRFTATFDNVDLTGHYTKFQLADYDRVNFTGSSLEFSDWIHLRDNASFAWNGFSANGAGNYPYLQTPAIEGDAGTELHLSLRDGSSLRGLSSITGRNGIAQFLVQLESLTNVNLPYIDNARVIIDSGTMKFSERPATISLAVNRGTGIVNSQMVFYDLHVDGTLETSDRLYTPALFGNGDIRLAGDTEFLWPYSGVKNYDGFTGTIDLQGHKLTLADSALLGKTSTIRGYGQIDLGTSANSHPVFNTNFADNNRYVNNLILNTRGPGSITFAPTEDSITPYINLHKRGAGELVLSGGYYQYNSVTVDEGRLTLADGITLRTANLSSAGQSELNIAGDTLLTGNLSANGSRFSLEGGLHVVGKTQFGRNTNFDYRGGLLTTEGALDLGDSIFSANLPHPGVFVVADYGSLGSRFGNAARNEQDVTSYVHIQNEGTNHPAVLSYTNDNQAKLVAASGYNLLYFAGPAYAGQGTWNIIPDLRNWKDTSGNDHAWDNSKFSIAIFDHAYSPAYLVQILNGSVHANMISFLDENWLLTNETANPNHNIILHPFTSGPDSRLHFTVLNSQANPRFTVQVPRLDIPLLVSDSSVPLWKTGAGDVILAADSSATSPDGFIPENVFIREGRLILEHNGALKNSLITLDPESALTLDWKISGTGNELLNTLAGYGTLEVLADTSIDNANADFRGAVSVGRGTTLSLYDFEALGEEPGVTDIELAENANLRLAYDQADSALLRSISGAGKVTAVTNTVARLASGNSYSGGSVVERDATLVLEGAGAEKVFSAAGDGAITLDENSALRLEGGGILRNALSGIAASTLQLAGMDAYTLEDNNLRSGAFAGAIDIEEALGVLKLTADKTSGDTVTPAFASIGGKGNLHLDGAGVTFDFTGISSNSYLGATVLGAETSLKLGGDRNSGQVGSGEIALQGKDSQLILEMNGANNTFENNLSGVGRLTLNNQAYQLTGDNSLFGGSISVPGTLLVDAQSEIGQARLLLGNGANLETQAASLENIIELTGGSATLNTVQDLLLSGAITGEGGLIKAGSGTLDLAFAMHDFNGPTAVNAGTLRLVDSTLGGRGNVTVADGAALAGRGAISGDTFIRSGGSLFADGMLSFYGQDGESTNLALESGSDITFSKGGWLDVSGELDWDLGSTTNTINLDSLGVYKLASYGSSTMGAGSLGNTDYTVNYGGADITNAPGYSMELFNYSAQQDVLLVALPTGQEIAFWNGGTNGLWNLNRTANWNSLYDGSGLSQTWTLNSPVAVFGTELAAPGAVNVQGNVASSGLFFLSTGWNISGGSIGLLDLDPLDADRLLAVLSNQGGDVFINSTLTDGAPGVGLHKSGAGRLVLGAANSYTGETLVSAGTLALGNIYAAGLNPAITVEAEAVLQLAYDEASLGLSQTVSGQGRLDIIGNVLLDKANTHSGGTSITGGTLHITDAGALGTGSLLFRNGLFSMLDGLNVANDVSLEGGFNIVTVAGGENATLSGNLNGDGMYKIGAGTLTLSGDSAFTGNLELEQGKLVAGSDTAFGYSTVHMLPGTTVGFSGARTLANNFSLDTAAIFEATSAGYATLGGVIHGSGDLLKIGDGTLTLSGANEYTGWTDVLEGTLALDASGKGRISEQLSLRGGATFDTGGNSIDLAELSAHWQSYYKGDLHIEDGIMRFTLPANVSPQGAPILNVDGRAEIGDSFIAIDFGGRDRMDLLPGNVLTLVQASGGIDGVPGNSVATGRLGITRAWEADLRTDPLHLYAEITSLGASPESKAFSEGFLAGLALLNQGGELAAGQGMQKVRTALSDAEAGQDEQQVKLASFSAVSGSMSGYSSGSRVDMSSVSLLTGLAAGWMGEDFAKQSGLRSLMLGMFFEYGNGSYDTHNSFSNIASVRGDGSAYYLGGGILARADLNDTGPGHFYVEASGRMGKVYNEYGSSDLRDSNTGVTGSYDSSSLYHSLHLGAGYLWNVSDLAELDLYGKYLWTRQEGESVTLSNGDPVKFKDVESQRLRIGGRFTYAVDKTITPYIGAAYEHEFDGEARASTYGYSIDTPSLRGNTGIGEIGLTLKPFTKDADGTGKSLPLSFDLGVQGYSGVRKGVSGSLQVKFEF